LKLPQNIRLKRTMDRVGKRHHKIPEKEVEEDVLQAIRAVRSGSYAKGRA